jgi:predicted enzyme related to lactoylglutathione lyase|tara:strand:- start:1634 stop:1753 length:120 start_codon:yes stop_codon:yes gene_type:complete
MFIWTDLMTTDTDGAKTFYSALLGWSYNERPTDIGAMGA